MEHGEDRTDRTGTGTRSLFDMDLCHDLSNGFPLLTTKKVHLRSIIFELIWFLRGDTNVKFLQSNGVTIWDEWADESGELGPVYGRQWRAFGRAGVDQLAKLVDDIKRKPDSRRLIVTAWNPEELEDMALPPCHCFFQCYVSRGTHLHLKMYQRSCDTFLGLPFNVASYALLLHVLANCTGLLPGVLTITLGDTHIYSNHFKQVETQLARVPFALPKLTIGRKLSAPWDLMYEDITVEGYQHHPAIAAPIAV